MRRATWRTVRVFISSTFRDRRTGHDQRAPTPFPTCAGSLRRPRLDLRRGIHDKESAFVDSTRLDRRLLARGSRI